MMNQPRTCSSTKSACNLFIGIDETFWTKLDGNMSRIEERSRSIVQGLNKIFTQSLFSSHPAYRELHFKIGRIEPVPSLCDGCNLDSLEYPHLLMDEFAKMDFSDYCLAYLFTDKNLHTTMSLANHNTVCEPFRPTCPRGQKSCRITGTLSEWPHWRSPNVGVISFAKIGHHINEEFTLLSVAHAFGYSFGAKSDEHEGNEQCGNQGYIMSRFPTKDRYSVCSYRAMVASLNKILFPTSNLATQRRNCFEESDPALSPAFCGNGLLEPGEECDCGWNDEGCPDLGKSHCCYPPVIKSRDKKENPGASACHLRPHCQTLAPNASSVSTIRPSHLAINQLDPSASLDNGQEQLAASKQATTTTAKIAAHTSGSPILNQILDRLTKVEEKQIGLQKKFEDLQATLHTQVSHD